MSDCDSRLKQILSAIVKELVDKPELVEVRETISDGGATSVLTVRVGNGETGKVIGRAGRNAQALRTILEAIAAKDRRRVMLEIADGRRRSRGRPGAGAENQEGG